MLANRGERLKPQLVEKIVTPDGEEIQEAKRTVLNKVEAKDEHWEILKRGMLKVFRTGFDDFPYEVAVKTGTSQQGVAGQMIDNAVFIAYAPADNPGAGHRRCRSRGRIRCLRCRAYCPGNI